MKLLVWLLPCVLSAQITASLSIVHRDGTKRLFDKRLARIASVWVVALENDSADTVALSEAALLRKVPELQPIDAVTMALYIDEGARNSGWAVAGRLTQDALQLSTVLAASEVIKVSQPILAGLTTAAAFGPYLISRLHGKEPPLLRNFQRLAWTDVIKLSPGQSATAHIFTAVWKDDSPSMTVTIDTSKLPTVKFAQ